MGFAERLQTARKKKGYNQKELSILLGKSKNVISNYENGLSKPNLDDFVELSSILDIDPNYLLYDELPDNIKNSISSSLNEADHTLITAYRSHPEAQASVNKLLDLPTEPSPGGRWHLRSK